MSTNLYSTHNMCVCAHNMFFWFVLTTSKRKQYYNISKCLVENKIVGNSCFIKQYEKYKQLQFKSETGLSSIFYYILYSDRLIKLKLLYLFILHYCLYLGPLRLLFSLNVKPLILFQSE